MPSNDGYVGAEQCKTCHNEIYEEWKSSGHSKIIYKPSNGNINIPLPEGYSVNEISYVIGGYKWKALFLDKNGYLITSTSRGDGRNQYNLKSKRWVDYKAGERVPYDCGMCHTTGYSPEGHQDGLEGIKGRWKFDGVQCEACHGPGALHIQSSLKRDIKIDRTICIRCHSIDPLDAIPVNDVFLAPYTEVNQLMKSKMKKFKCVNCHNSHRSSEKSIKQSCESCHQKIALRYENSYMHRVGVKCIDCHMPQAGLIAEGDRETFTGDLKSHLFRIDHTKKFPFFIKDNEKVNPGYLSVDYACIRCHNLYEDRERMSGFAMVAHKIKITTNIKIMRLQMVFATIGFLSALIAMLSALSLKGWFWAILKKKTLLSVHRNSVWISFFIYLFIATLCIYFHTPLDNPAKIFNLGWFLIHPINGISGIVLYSGKIISVRKFKQGWKRPGLIWGIGIFIFWIVQYMTVILSFFNIVRV